MGVYDGLDACEICELFPRPPCYRSSHRHTDNRAVLQIWPGCVLKLCRVELVSTWMGSSWETRSRGVREVSRGRSPCGQRQHLSVVTRTQYSQRAPSLNRGPDLSTLTSAHPSLTGCFTPSQNITHRSKHTEYETSLHLLQNPAPRCIQNITNTF